jgi:hypothetical protein
MSASKGWVAAAVAAASWPCAASGDRASQAHGTLAPASTSAYLNKAPLLRIPPHLDFVGTPLLCSRGVRINQCIER